MASERIQGHIDRLLDQVDEAMESAQLGAGTVTAPKLF